MGGEIGIEGKKAQSARSDKGRASSSSIQVFVSNSGPHTGVWLMAIGERLAVVRVAHGSDASLRMILQPNVFDQGSESTIASERNIEPGHADPQEEGVTIKQAS
jgi:hypothetical protein